MALRRTLSWGEGWGGDGRSGTVTLELKSFYGRSDRRARGDRRGLGGCMRRSPCMCTSPPPVVKTSAEQGGKGGSGAPMELKAWLEQQSLDAETVRSQLELIGIDELSELLTLRPEEVEALDVSLQDKHTLVSAIGSSLDLFVWLHDWGLSGLNAQIDELGVETPEDLLDLSPDEIDALQAKLVEKLQLSKAIAHLDSEHAALAERRALLRQKREANDAAMMPPPPAPASPCKRPPADAGGCRGQARSCQEPLETPPRSLLPSASPRWSREDAETDGPKTWSGMSSVAASGGLSAGMFGLTSAAGAQRKSCIGGSRPPSAVKAISSVKPPLGKTIGKRRVADRRAGRRNSPPRKGFSHIFQQAVDVRTLRTVECPF